jgi:regulatory protein YycH of two-component signal transduction system YycFG
MADYNKHFYKLYVEFGGDIEMVFENSRPLAVFSKALLLSESRAYQRVWVEVFVQRRGGVICDKPKYCVPEQKIEA